MATKFRDDKGHVTDVELGCSNTSDANKACEKSAFKSFIEERLALSIEVDCDMDYDQAIGRTTYADVDAYLAQLLEDLNVGSSLEDSHILSK